MPAVRCSAQSSVSRRLLLAAACSWWHAGGSWWHASRQCGCCGSSWLGHCILPCYLQYVQGFSSSSCSSSDLELPVDRNVGCSVQMTRYEQQRAAVLAERWGLRVRLKDAAIAAVLFDASMAIAACCCGVCCRVICFSSSQLPGCAARSLVPYMDMSSKLACTRLSYGKCTASPVVE